VFKRILKVTSPCISGPGTFRASTSLSDPKTAIEEGPGIPRDSGTALRPSEGQAVGGKDRPGSSHAGYRAVQSVLDPLEELTVPLSHVFGHNYPFP